MSSNEYMIRAIDAMNNLVIAAANNDDAHDHLVIVQRHLASRLEQTRPPVDIDALTDEDLI